MSLTSFVEPDFFLPSPSDWPFGHLAPRAYSLIMIDCAWRFMTRTDKGCEKSPQAHYRTMTIEEIRALPVRDLAHPDGCLIWMWGTAPMAHLHPQIMIDWGFKFSTSGVWIKRTKNGKLNFGTGYVLRGSHEPFYIGHLHSPELKSKSVRSVIEAQIREYSRKPDEAYAAARQMIPYGRAADVYSRESRAGWESYGDEAGKFDEGNNNETDTRAGTGKLHGARDRGARAGRSALEGL